MADSSIEQLIESFRKFPGIGPRQARRFVYFLLRQPKSSLANLARQIEMAKDSINQCELCFRYFQFHNNKETICNTCADLNRDKSSLLILEKDIDFENVRKADSYTGMYFILGGLVSFTDKEPEKRIHINELIKRVEKSGGEIKEIILALSANTEGDHTAEYVKKALSPLAEKNNIKVSTLGRGLSTGVELEYSDIDTFENALKNRQ